MKLFYSPASPFARKVLVLAYETGLIDQITPVACVLSPVAPNASVVEENPIGKIPTLLLDNGTALYDSRVICEYLDELHEGKKMFPPAGSSRWETLTLQSLTDGILDAAVLIRYETYERSEQHQWREWIENQKLKIFRSLARIEKEIENLTGTLNIGVIGIGCVLGYLDFRFPDENWRNRCPKLAEWFLEFNQRTSMQSTRPH
ncbi:MAG: glutathione S-transferase [SAR324 cluster bacterium]|nr:glutathione S-transferase [SAR324 cluster bacterium]